MAERWRLVPDPQREGGVEGETQREKALREESGKPVPGARADEHARTPWNHRAYGRPRVPAASTKMLTKKNS